jgi:dTDP-4-amino-4,6-dideoxygalactose transaminase
VGLYEEQLVNLEGEVHLLTEAPVQRTSYHLMVARIAGSAERRQRVFEHPHAAGVPGQMHCIAGHLQPSYHGRFGFWKGNYPQAEAYYAACVSQPLFPQITDGDITRVARAPRSTLEGAT